ncbi:MAG: VOC family protein [Armatimonadetes bacterium]|nr:VOC family protein [Armatimonadota bacterium]
MRFLHTMIRVNDLEKSVQFYRDALGFEERRRVENESGKFTLVFLAPPGAPEDTPLIELTYNWGRTEPYERGNAYGHMAFGVDSFDAVDERLKAHGLGFSWGPRGKMAFVEDPDGYEIELLLR